jgi:hypothetical protein
MAPKVKQRMLKQVLQMKPLPKDVFCLGAPLFTTRNRTKDFKFLHERLKARLLGWRSKCLSWAGRNTMIKSVAQALPTYTLSTFEIPERTSEKLDSITGRFWWNPKKESRRYLAWKSWDHLCQVKKNGGLGFRHTNDFNKALIAKLAWMVAVGKDSLCMTALRSKYKVRKGWLRREPIRNVSQIWQAIERAREVLIKGACFLVGDSKSIDVWQDPWIPWCE